jgi:hypothetical protein
VKFWDAPSVPPLSRLHCTFQARTGWLRNSHDGGPLATVREHLGGGGGVARRAARDDQGVHRGRAAMSRHRLFYFMELKEPKATHGLFPSLSWCCYRVEWRPGQKFHDTYPDVGDCVIEVSQDKFVFAVIAGALHVIGTITSALGIAVRKNADPWHGRGR